MNTKRIIKGLCLVALSILSATGSRAATIEVTPWSAPNAFGSPSFSDAVANEIFALKNGLSSYGDASLPTYFETAPSEMEVSENMVTGYPSWLGSADPAGDFGAAFAAELGNRLHFGILITGDGEEISISELGFSAISTDPDNTLGFSFAPGSYNYSLQYQGWDYGLDETPLTGDDVMITSGPNTQLVDAIVGRGSGNAWASYLTDPGETPQDKLNGQIASVYSGPFTFTGTYTLGEAVGSGSVNFNVEQPVPEPSTILGGIALMSLTFMAHRKK